MRKRISNHVTYANVMATIAVFMVLGGGAYAATKLPKNSVGTAQIKNKAVTKAKLAKGVAVSGPKGDKGDTGPAGPKGETGTAGTNGTNGTPGGKGDKGDIGDTGARGPSDLYAVDGSDFADLDNTTGSTIGTIIIPSGKYLTQAKAVLSSTNAATVDCLLFTSGHAGTPIDQASVKIPAGGQTEVNLVGPEAIGSNFLLFTCDDNGVAGGASAAKGKLTALQVETLH